MYRFLTLAASSLILASLAHGQTYRFATTIPIVNGWNYETRATGNTTSDCECRSNTCTAWAPGDGLNRNTAILWANEFQNFSLGECQVITRVSVSVRATFGAENGSATSGTMRLEVRGNFSPPADTTFDINGNCAWRGSQNGEEWDITNRRSTWSAADINALRVGVQRTNDSVPPVPLWLDAYRIHVETATVPPLNDSCANPAAAATGSLRFDNRCATTGAEGQTGYGPIFEGEPAVQGSARDLWYLWTAPSDGEIAISVVADDTSAFHRLSIYNDACGANRLASMVDDSILTKVVAGHTYFIQLGDYPDPDFGAEPGAGTLHIAFTARPHNDHPAGALPITGRGPFSINTSEATVGPEATEPCGSFGMGYDLWYVWSADHTGPVALSTIGLTEDDSMIVVYEQDGYPTPIDCNDDAVGTLASRVDFMAIQGHRYFFQIGGFFDSISGAFEVLAPCGKADVGVAEGLPGFDGVLDNNDFIAFITLFFSLDTKADLGVAGGFPGADGRFDNNDFIAFINLFFTGC